MDMYKRIEYVCRQIPYGKAATYGQIALLCGVPRNARQVGYALSHRLTTEIPAHRIVNGKGYLSGASSFETAGAQRKLLKKERVAVSEDNIVDLKKYGWEHTLDDALLFRQYFEEQQI